MSGTPFILDLYAGAGGWDEGARILGLPTVGLELEHDPCVTAVRAGHPRIRCDVSRYPTCALVGVIAGLVGSPPCTTFSSAGSGAGRQIIAILIRALNELAAGKATRAARRKECQRAIAAWALTKRPKMRRAERAAWAWRQARSAVQVLEPLRYARDLRPEWIALEQVEAVLPIWRHLAHILRGWGYYAVVDVLNAADYGVPQTRKRAVLIASRVRPVAQPEPTHERAPDEYALFSRLAWVSMAEALGWNGAVNRRTNSKGAGGTRVPTVTVHTDCPAPTLNSKAGAQWVVETENRSETSAGRIPYRRSVDLPAPTVVSNADRWTLLNGAQKNATARAADEPAGTIYCSRPGNLRWALERPATTVQGDPRIGRPGHKDREGGESQFGQDALRVTVTEAAILQSFPADYPWHGNKTSTFLQVGNAVPPRLMAAVIGAATGADWQTAVADHYATTAQEAAA